ncbi:hypothetical protein RMQ62_04290 [Streptococcus suis]|uniref:hypothetical protein n=1 Tax=Streptococcus suis TaxID=1307 RepID=UPI0028A59F4A|nr:hypothetical protein [Streptococcus suis]WNN12004.1 hypothetical protein RMQ62_04290 [Streptococcus suis]
MMKKLLVLGALAMLGFVTFGLLTINSSSASAKTEGKVVLFGNVDFSDDEEQDMDEEREEVATESEDAWLA